MAKTWLWFEEIGRKTISCMATTRVVRRVVVQVAAVDTQTIAGTIIVAAGMQMVVGTMIAGRKDESLLRTMEVETDQDAVVDAASADRKPTISKLRLTSRDRSSSRAKIKTRTRIKVGEIEISGTNRIRTNLRIRVRTNEKIVSGSAISIRALTASSLPQLEQLWELSPPDTSLAQRSFRTRRTPGRVSCGRTGR